MLFRSARSADRWHNRFRANGNGRLDDGRDNGCRANGRWNLALASEGSGKIGEVRLSPGEIARLQRLTDGLEILGAIGSPEYLSICSGAALAECGQGVEVLLGCSQVAGFQILSELSDIRLLLLPVGLYLLIDRRASCRERV